MNGLFDPDQTFVGHQPYARDVYAQMYNKYKVLSFKYNVRAIGSYNSPPLAIGVVSTNGLASLGSMTLLAESDNSKSSITSYGQVAVLKGQHNLARFTGRSQAEYDADSLYEAQQGSNPTEQMGFHIGVANPQNSVTSCLLKVVLEYTVEFFDPIQQAQS